MSIANWFATPPTSVVYVNRPAITVRYKAAGQAAMVGGLLIRVILWGRVVFFEATTLGRDVGAFVERERRNRWSNPGRRRTSRR